jgi:predicted permease
VLVVVELALSLVLLVSAGLVIRSFGALLHEGVGFPTDHLLAGEINFGGSGLATEAERTAFIERLVQRAEALPAVESASGGTFLPMSGTGSATSFWANDRPVPAPGQAPVADIRPVHRDYHAVMGIPILRGRGFDAGDGPDAPLRVVVNEATVHRLWPDTDPIGKTISMPWGDTLVAEVIGVAGNVRVNGPAEAPRPLLYWNRAQWSPFGGFTVVARTAGSAAAAAPALRSLVHEMNPAMPLFNVRTVASDLADAVGRTRFAMAVLAAFAALALLLAAIGVYGVMSYAVGQRSHEFGVRMTFGATRADVLRTVLGHGAVLVSVAVLTGGVVAFAGTRLLQGLLFGVSPGDVLTFTATAAVLVTAGLLAAWVPARRAASADPMDALRTE